MTAEEPVLVTGATGFLGTHLCQALDDTEQEVRALRRRSSDTSALADCDIEWRVCDICDAASVQSAMEGCHSVYHLAGIGLAAGDAETVRRVNVTGTENVLSAALEADVDRVVFTSTAGTRRSDGIANETDVASPVGAYQESKAEAETLVDEYGDRGLDVVTVHPTSVFGPGDTEFTAQLLSIATNPALFGYLPGSLSFVGVDDVVDGLESAMTDGRPGDHYIIGGENLRIGTALERIAEVADGYPPRVPVPGPVIHAAGHVAAACESHLDFRFFPYSPAMASLATQDLVYSSEKAQRELGYDYEPLKAHVPDALQWYREEND